MHNTTAFPAVFEKSLVCNTKIYDLYSSGKKTAKRKKATCSGSTNVSAGQDEELRSSRPSHRALHGRSPRVLFLAPHNSRFARSRCWSRRFLASAEEKRAQVSNVTHHQDTWKRFTFADLYGSSKYEQQINSAFLHGFEWLFVCFANI